MKPVIDVIGVPFALGGSKTGPARGPDALVNEGLVPYLTTRGFTARFVNIKNTSQQSEYFDRAPVRSGKVCSMESVHAVTKLAGAHVFASLRVGHLPIVVGGDHSVSIGTLPQILDPTITGNRRVLLIWLDAHYDAHTPKTTHSHYANGLPLASVLGRGDRTLGCYAMTEIGKPLRRLKYGTKNVIHIGAGHSDCEPEETEFLRRRGVQCISMDEIQTSGMSHTIASLAKHIQRADDVVVTLDLDMIRKEYAPGVSFQSVHGALPSQVMLIAKAVAESKKLRQLEIMEYNPDFEVWDKSGNPRTAHLALSVIGAFLGGHT